jgi:hypothetical protein
MATVSVNLDPTQYVQVNTGFNPLLLQSHRDDVRITLSELKPAKTNSVYHTLGGNDDPMQFLSLDTNVWALPTSDKCSLVATETDPVHVALYDALGNPYESDDGSIPTITHQHAQIHQGNGFTHADIHPALAADTTETHLMITGDDPVHLRSFNIQTTAAPCTVEYFEDVVTTDDGDLLGAGNNNRTSDNTPTMMLYQNPVITDIGNPIGKSLIPSVAQKGGNGLDIITGGEWILKPNTKYSYGVTNNTNQEIDFSTVIFWYEPQLG